MKLGLEKKKQKLPQEVAGLTVFESPEEDMGGQERQPMISIRDLHKSYGEKKVLKGLNLEVYPGELFGFIGKNGIGKSTTIDCVIGSKKFDQGSIFLDGYDVKKEPIEAKFTFGYVASEPSCYEVMTGYDYLEFVASIYKITEGDFVRNYRYLCGRLNLDEAEPSSMDLVSELSNEAL